MSCEQTDPVRDGDRAHPNAMPVAPMHFGHPGDG